MAYGAFQPNSDGSGWRGSAGSGFAGLGAIAIHALRVADLRFGESAVVVGLGILGQIIAQIAHAAACPVAGFDLNPERVQG